MPQALLIRRALAPHTNKLLHSRSLYTSYKPLPLYTTPSFTQIRTFATDRATSSTSTPTTPRM